MVMRKRFVLFLIITITVVCNNAVMACLSITDDLNLQNPVLSATFRIEPDVDPFTDCWSGTLRIRSDKNNWRLIANRIGPTPLNVSGSPEHNIKAHDITLELMIKSFGMASDDGAILVSPFSLQTDLSSIQSGTFVVAGIKRSGNGCSSNNPSFYKLTQDICLFRDFVFNAGEYRGELAYTLIAP